MLNKTLKISAIISAGVLTLAIPFAVFAWSTGQSATAICNNAGQGVINVSFTNQETSASMGMNVTVKDNQTGDSTNLGTIASQQTKNGSINTGKNTLNNGTVTFFLTWASGNSGTDQRTANYSGVTCQSAIPTPTKAPTPTPTKEITPTPTNAPTPTPTKEVTPTPTSQPSITPTVTPAVPTPTTQSGTTNENNNNNQQDQNQGQAQSQSQDSTNNNNNSSNSSSNSSSSIGDINVTNNVTNTNTSTATVEAATAQNTTVQPVPTNTAELPKTGPSDIVYSLFTLLPIGWKLRKLANLS